MTAVREALPGILWCALLATAALLLAEQPFVKDTLHLSALLLVILLGMALRTVMAVPAWAAPGVRMAQRPILRWAVAGLGFRLSLGEIARIGGPALVVVVASTFAALLFGVWIGRRLGLAPKLATLLAVGGGICGASAVVAADSVVHAEKRDSALALGIITLLGTIGIVAYPWIGRAAGMGDFLYGVWDGASLHEMAQVVAAGAGFSKEATEVATVVKLVRISLLAPVVFFLAWRMRRDAAGTPGAPSASAVGFSATAPTGASAGRPNVPIVPWFLVLFVVFAAVNSLGWLDPTVVRQIQRADLWLLCLGMAGVGLQTSFADLGRAGWAPIATGTAQWLLLAVLAWGLAVALLR
ncbi:MAG TPA: putative sulfate exporter family transporter [Gemmatimonadales bacterium]|nr:putative sulfate exporter family transporter [Gemmatimonadales bacterium]